MLFRTVDNPALHGTIAPMREMAAYESMWSDRKTSFKWIAGLFRSNPDSFLSDHVTQERISEMMPLIKSIVRDTNALYAFNILLKGTMDFPRTLGDAKEPLEMIYYAGNLNYLSTRMVSVVGTRNPSEEGLSRTRRIVAALVKEDITVVSGLAAGIDSMAHNTTIDLGGRTIAVIGTPLNHFYPKQNKSLQEKIAKEYLLISQVPFFRYSNQTVAGNRLFFPERNKTMSALSEATIIVEASDTSGTLIQAKAAIQQNRKLIILGSCLDNKSISWPSRFLDLGAFRADTPNDIIKILNSDG